MRKIIMLKGLPGSGKSTYAKKLVTDNPNKYKRVNKDDLRAMLDAGKWGSKNEKFVLLMRDTAIANALALGYIPIIDDTNLDPKHEIRLRDIAAGMHAEFELMDFTYVSLTTCIERDAKRPTPVGAKVITGMYNKYLKPVIEYNDDLHDCYIFDIDGTLAVMGDRSPFDWAKVGKDSVNPAIVRIYKKLNSFDSAFFIIFSGRDGSCFEETSQWLEDNNIKHDGLYMRTAGDSRSDAVVKLELYKKHVRDRYNVVAVFDDRDKVVDLWRSLGLTCLQVNYGNF